MATQICAHYLQPSSLTTRDLSGLCQDYVNGLCPRPDYCDRDHTLYHIQQGSPRPKVVAVKNYLSLALRSVSKSDCFDQDGPGHLSKRGARHDNDFVRIKDIQILPTTDEVLSLRPPYVPFKDPNTTHFLTKGFSRHIDCLFRQFRADNIEMLKDVCYHAAQKLATDTPRPPKLAPRQETSNGKVYSLFWGVHLEGLLYHHNKGLMVRVSFACPQSLLGRHIHKSAHFESGMMAALVGLDENETLSVTFFEIHLCESTESMHSKVETNEPRGTTSSYS